MSIKEDNVLLLAFPSIGLVGKLAISYIVYSQKMQKIGEVDYPELPPVLFVEDGEIIGPIQIYKKNKIHVVLSDQPFDPFVAKDFAKLVLAYCKKNSIKKFFMVSGIENLNKNPKTTKVYGLVTHQILEKILYNNIIPKFINGSILGSDAAIISVFRKSSVPALILYSECHPYFPDPDAAISAINILAKILKIKTNKADIQKSMEYLRIQNRNLMADTIKTLQQEKSQKVRTPHIYR